ncbi:MAG: hypothetical protein HOQ10_16055, partial [Frateuria sp.]|nr:hypothetical protein [Frateuria sp.]
MEAQLIVGHVQRNSPALANRRQMMLVTLAAATQARVAAADVLAVPPFSAAPTGPGPAPGWQHQALPKVERPNSFEIVADGGR